MCGIIGYTGSKDAVPIIIEGLKKLEYRGYDSAGIAILSGGSVSIVKQKGRLAALEARLSEAPLSGHMGIGHTRWATHGEPSDENSHTHVGSQSKIAIVHNGIIENYRQLKDSLEKKGVCFASQTDSEVIAQLAEYYYQGDIIDTIIQVAGRLEGSYALGIMCLDCPDVLIAVKKDNPLIIGVAGHGHFIASDVPAVLGHTDTVHYLDDGEIAILEKTNVRFLNFDKEPLLKSPEKITWSLDSAEKGGYSHFMLKEIFEQPMVLADTYKSAVQGVNKEIIDAVELGRYNKILIAACGSAYNAGVVARYVFESLCRMSVEVELASELRYRDAIIDEKTLVILISQSGETADSIAAMREAKAKGAQVLAIVNVVGSTIAKEADYSIYTIAGPEIAVATTKVFSAQLMLLYILALDFARRLGRISGQREQELLTELSTLPEKVAALLEKTDEVQQYAAACIAYKSIFFIGRGVDYAIALEGSLKLKEISYIHSEAYAGGELKHGPIALMENNTLVVVLSNSERLSPKIKSNAEQVLSRGAKVLFVGSLAAEAEGDLATTISLPATNELFSPSLSVIILQLFSYYVAANKGLDIDKPRNLAKSVTVE